MHLADCPHCDGLGGHPFDTGGFAPWGEPIDGWATCEACSGRGWVFEEDPASEVESASELLAKKHRHGVDFMLECVVYCKGEFAFYRDDVQVKRLGMGFMCQIPASVFREKYDGEKTD